MSTLLIQLSAKPANFATEYLYVLSDDGQSVQRSGQAAASLLPATGRTTQVTAVIPAAQLSWHRVTLPPGLNLQGRRQQRLRAVLEGLLEEKLLDEPAALHLALDAGPVAGQSCWVAACDKSWLQSHLQALEHHGHAASRLVPEQWPSSHPQLLLSGDGLQPQLSITGLDAQTGLVALPQKADASLLQSLLARLPEDLPVLAEPHLARIAEALQRPVTIFTAAQRLLQSHGYAGDLAQFDLDLGGGTRARRRLLDAWHGFAKAPQWRAARWAAGIAIVAQLIGLNAWAVKENRAIALRQQQAKQVLQTTFPHVPVVIDAPVQMQRELELLRSNSGALSPGDLEALLAASAGIQGVQNARSLQYQDRQLRISGLDLSPEALSDAQQSLEAGGYRLQREAADLVLSAKAQP
ncbi:MULTISPECIES: type II secretion system protein GspL [Comamonas]|jgi:general secretion pathway protein L|uniref:type II secretion system protein GspL n=1 Tax=Comamonas TaxID=283 RepID=UPI0012CF74FF|nr:MULTISPECIES: type II secretion system protein GspL [Comamonas]MDR3067382.1 general secretion pathway protein GspL [Comamonas sp.]MEB5965908.1 type II secretion system protein GspL [Comamonas testosteroni]MPS96826.1 general secretion pathway protein GspL [Comamonas sp.]